MSLNAHPISLGCTRLAGQSFARISSARPCSRPARCGAVNVQAGRPSGQIFVAGADGMLGSRLAKELAEAGFSVTAGVTEADKVQPISRFIAKYALIPKDSKLNVVDMEEDDALNKALPRGARVVCVDGDVAGRKKIGAKEVSRVLKVAQDKRANDFVLVSCSGGGSGLSGLFGGGGGLRLENLVANSGLSYTIIRGANSDRESGGSDGIRVGMPGTATGGAPSRGQMADVVAAVLEDSCSNAVLDVKSDSSGGLPPLAVQLKAAARN